MNRFNTELELINNIFSTFNINNINDYQTLLLLIYKHLEISNNSSDSITQELVNKLSILIPQIEKISKNNTEDLYNKYLSNRLQLAAPYHLGGSKR